MRSFGPLVFVAFGLLGAWRWHRSGVRIPRFVHVLAVVGLALGGWMAWLDKTTGEFTWNRALVEVAVMPLLVYLGFFVYGRRLLAQRKSELPSNER